MKTRFVAHGGFVVALACGVILRVVVMLGYRWQMWFPDSYDYVTAAVHPRPGVIRPTGYPLMLWALRPLGGLAPVTVAQHLMGLGVGVMVYALLRRNGLSGRVATIAALPVLLDAYQVQLEHLVLSDTLFMVLVSGAVTVMLWRYELTARRAAAAGLLLGLATIVRTVGLPLLMVVVAFLLARRVPWRMLGAAVVACALPVAAYAGWYYEDQGRLALGGSTGVFLYSRTLSFADCARMNPPEPERRLCPQGPKGRRDASMVWRNDSPLRRLPGPRFTAEKDRLAGDFAVRAVRTQPLDYLAAVTVDVARTFRPDHPAFPDPQTYRYYLFRPTSIVPPGRALRQAHQYAGGPAVTRVVPPYSSALRSYQRYVHLPGTVLGLILLTGAAGMVARRRRLGGRVSLPWGIAVALIVIPPTTTGFDYRYVLPAVPSACVAAALVARVRRRPDETFGTPRTLDVAAHGSDRE